LKENQESSPLRLRSIGMDNERIRKGYGKDFERNRKSKIIFWNDLEPIWRVNGKEGIWRVKNPL
jgi:hypothetical protein